MVITIEYVPEEDTLAIVTIKETQSASLRTTNAILIAGLLIAAYFLNTLFLVAVLITKTFRTTVYLMFCHLTVINLIDITFNIFFALVFVANGSWNMSIGWCTFNVAIQEFVHLHTLFVLMLIGAERALGIVLGPEYVIHGHKYLNGKKLAVVSFLLGIISTSFASAVFLSVIPTKPFRNRYVCGIDGGGPIGYVIARLIVYFGSLAVILVAIGAILKKRSVSSIPQNNQEYAEFIKRNRAMQEHKSRGKLMIFITSVFILIEGPYITLCFFYESYNSREFSDESVDIPQDADTLITWLKFVFPLLCPIILLCWCNDVWQKVKEVMCCRSYDPPTIGHQMPDFEGAQNDLTPVISIVRGEAGLKPEVDHAYARNAWQREQNFINEPPIVQQIPQTISPAPVLRTVSLQQNEPQKQIGKKKDIPSKIPRRKTVPKKPTKKTSPEHSSVFSVN